MAVTRMVVELKIFYKKPLTYGLAKWLNLTRKKNEKEGTQQNLTPASLIFSPK
jgi:hypothetical protein